MKIVTGHILAALMLVSIATSAAAQPLRTAVYPVLELSAPQPELTLARIHAAGASVVRITVIWSQIAPKVRPPQFSPADPGETAYSWNALDASVRAARLEGLTPYITVLGAPTWAQGSPAASELNSYKPNAIYFGQFMHAIAKRYSGSYLGLPRVRYWQIWNEPNLSLYLTPQLVAGKPASPAIYRRLLNTGGAAVKTVHPNNFVIAGGLAPFRDITPEVLAQDQDWGPLSFMRAVLCLTPKGRAVCSARASFDAWAMHPYTSGGPTHHAVLANDVSIGDLPEIKPILTAARRHGHIRAARFPEIWVTEFSWDSNAPDPNGVPMSILPHWVAEAMYRMWTSGVSLVTWFTLRDTPLSESFYQSGLYYRGSSIGSDRPKPFLAAFRFPFVGFAVKGGVYVWGRVPPGSTGAVLIERSRPTGGWTRLGTLQTDGSGIFAHTFATFAQGLVRARALSSGTKAVPFSLKPVPDHFYNPFGQPTKLEPKKR